MSKVFLILLFIFFFTLPLFAQSVDTAWVRRYNGPGWGPDIALAIAVDGSGNVYVTGYSYGIMTWYDYVTIKYYPDGDAAWVRRYNSPGNDLDYARAIAVDGSGNVYVTGDCQFRYTTIKYLASGDTAWVRRYNAYGLPFAIALDDSGNVCVTGTTLLGQTYDYTTVKYNPSGDTTWVRRYNGPGNSYDVPAAIAIDDFGNIYVTGLSLGIGTSFDYATLKYYQNGDTAWVRRYNGTSNFSDSASSIAVDYLGNVYVAGTSYSSGTGYDFVTIKYYPNGDTAWVRRYNGPGDSVDVATALEVDSSGNIYVTGKSLAATGDFDYATIKYHPSGDTFWVRRYNGPGNGSDDAYAIAVDGSGNVYVTGFSYGSGTDADYATIKYDPSGNELWVKRYNGPPGNDGDAAYAIAVDGSGNVYVTGGSFGGSEDYATIKYVQFLRGDANKDKKVNIVDAVCLIYYLLKGGPAPSPWQAGDANCDGTVTIADVVFLVSYLFKGGPLPCR